MALPTVNSLAECADFSLTVQPFLSQLQELPSRILEAGTDVETLKEVYLATNPFITSLAFSLALAALVLVFSELTRNHSQVDRVWSLLPTVYNAHYATWAYLHGLPTETLNTIMMFSAIWSVRLTFNYFRKGGYSIGSEDYRWKIIKDYINSPALFFVFNVVFISLGQSLLLQLITAPTYIFLLRSTLPEGASFDLPDVIFSRVLIVLIILETFADQQQWKYQQAKKEYQEAARIPEKYKDVYTQEDLDRGFVVSGVWSWCRHPNFAAEQAIWVTLYQWACYDTDTLFNWTAIGALSILALFQGSTWLTEKLTAAKYPEYKEYQALVGKFIPRWSVEAKADVKKRASKGPKSKGN